jgi:competence protein ComEA
MDVSGGTSTSSASESPRVSHEPSSIGSAANSALAPPTADSPASTSSSVHPKNPSPTSSHRKPGFWLSHADQLLLAFLCTVMLVLLVAYWARSTKWGAIPIEIERAEPRKFDFRLDINSATWVEWTQLEGIGDALARRIVADRESNGPFSSIDDLRRVKGIGPKTLEKIRPWLTIDSDTSSQSGTTPARSKHTNLTGR